MKADKLTELIESDKARNLFNDLYGVKSYDVQKKRYISVIKSFLNEYGHIDDDLFIFSSPGRTEIIGNHTDHNNGKVVGAAIDLDCVAVAVKRDDGVINILSEGYGKKITVDTTDIEKLHKFNKIGSSDLIKGIVCAMHKYFKNISIGFDVYINSNVISSAGVSSSASFETLICGIIDKFYPGVFKSKVDYALYSRYAENIAWDKASGMLDQLSCCVGGAISIDFSSKEEDKDALYNEHGISIKRAEPDFDKYGYSILLVQTGKGHADLSKEYSDIPNEMKEVAAYYGKDVLAEVDESRFYKDIHDMKDKISHRGILRALHFFEENKRVDKLFESICKEDMESVLLCMKKSGDSSFKYLQNCYVNTQVDVQLVSLALALTDKFINDKGRGICRVHGGGFSGVIAVVLPKDIKDEYIEYIETYFGTGCVHEVRIRPHGTICVNDLL